MWLAALAGSAAAAGFVVAEPDARALGRGGAVVAGVDDLSAQYWNPAGLVRLDGLEVHADLALVARQATFAREPAPGETGPFDPVEDEAGYRPVPTLAAGFRRGDVAVAVGAWAPYAPVARWPAAGAQRYSVIEQRLVAVTVGPSVALHRGKLAIGASVGATWARVDQTLAATLASPASEDPDYDVVTTVSATDALSPSANVGVLYDAGPVTFGASAQSPVRASATGSLTVDLSQNAYYTGSSASGKLVAAPTVTDDDVTVPIALPAVLRAGIAWRPSDVAEIELDVAWEGWKASSDLVVDDLQLDVPTTGGDPIEVRDPIRVPLAMRDAGSVRLGGELAVGAFRLRAGVLGETSGVDASVAGPSLPDGPKLGGAAGLTWSRGPLDLDVGFAETAVLPRSTDRSTLLQVAIDPLSGDVRFGDVVGDGRLTAATTTFAVGATLRLGHPPSAGSSPPSGTGG